MKQMLALLFLAGGSPGLALIPSAAEEGGASEQECTSRHIRQRRNRKPR